MDPQVIIHHQLKLMRYELAKYKTYSFRQITLAHDSCHSSVETVSLLLPRKLHQPPANYTFSNTTLSEHQTSDSPTNYNPAFWAPPSGCFWQLP